MVKTREIGTSKTVGQTMQDLRDIFDQWGVDRQDWRMSKYLSGVEVQYYMPYDNQAHKVTCYGQRTEAQNLRGCFMSLEADQRDSFRGVRKSYAGIEYLALPPGTAQEAQQAYREAPPRPRASRAERGIYKNMREACEFLSVVNDAPEEIVNAAYRAKARKVNGEAESMRKLNAARDFIYERNGWAVQKEAVEA